MSEQDRTLPGAATDSPPMTSAGLVDARAGGTAAHLRAVLRSARPRQWTKNLIIYLAFLFTANDAWSTLGPTSTLGLLVKTTIAFVIFTALTSAVYLVNDVVDAELDRRHPRKRLRPIASGRLAPQAS